MPDLDSRLTNTIFAANVHRFERVESTNSLALEAAAQGAPEGTLFIADEQTAGRGRGGHAWHSEAAAGLYFSFVLRPANMTAQNALWLSLAAGAAVHSGVLHATGLAADLRWPNDLLLGDKKFCGILAEQQSDGDTVRFAVIGIGINVNHTDFPDELADIATSLRLVSGHSHDRIEILAAVLHAFDREYRALRNAPGDLFHRLPQISTWISGKAVFVPEQGGYTGITAGLDPRGFLLVQTNNGLRAVLSGGVREMLLTEKEAEEH